MFWSYFRPPCSFYFILGFSDASKVVLLWMWGSIVSPTLCYFYYDCLFIDSSFNTQVPWGQKLDFICYCVHHPGTRIPWKSSGDKCVAETWEAIPCTFKLWLLVFIQIIPVWSLVLCLSGRGRETSEFQVSLVCLQRAFQPSQDCGVRPWPRKKENAFVFMSWYFPVERVLTGCRDLKYFFPVG